MKKTISSDGTIKITFPQGHSSVIIPTKKDRYTLCLSTQIGCPMKCEFCQSSKTPFKRNLTLEELKEQLEKSIEQVKTHDSNFPFSSIVFMGMGEPLLNLQNILKFSEYINKKYSFSFAKITISTSGIIPKMEEVIEYKYPIQLALSLHTTNQKTRNALMPHLKKYPIKDLIKTCKKYNEKYKQKIMIEYLMIKGLTDTEDNLNNLLKFNLEKYTNFNLIPLNSKTEFPYERSEPQKTEQFKTKLRESGYKCFVRESTGKDIEAACGMLK